jgi:hypothetical protein
MFTTDALVWTHYFEKPNKKLDEDKLERWNQAMEESLGTAIDTACAALGIPRTKANRSHILALAVVTRGSELAERVKTAARFYKDNVIANEL